MAILACGLLAAVMMFGPEGSSRAVSTPGTPTSGAFSWNPNVNCTPMFVNIEQVIGNQTGPQGGATETGSHFNPGITSSYGPDITRSWLTPSASTPRGWVSPGPPCVIRNASGQNVSAFVQINGVERTYTAEEGWSTTFSAINGGTAYPNGNQSQTKFSVITPGYGVCTTTNTTGCMHSIKLQIDHDWKGASYCGPFTVCDNSTLVSETVPFKTLIDVQGFVFWNPDDLNDSAHNFSGWELHPVTAWRLSNTPPDYSLKANSGSITMFAGQSASSNITVNSFNLFTGTLSFSSTVSQLSATTGSFPTATMTPTSLLIPADGRALTTLTVSAALTGSGNYTVVVSGTNGTMTRATTIAVSIADFSIAANPASLSIASGSSATSTVILASLNRFTGNVTLQVTVAPASLTGSASPAQPTASLNPSQLNLQPNGTNSATLTVSTSLLTLPGTYDVTIAAASGTDSHTTTVVVAVTVAGLV